MSEIRAIWAGHAATPTIEERRAALMLGEVITDPALLAVGMWVYTGVRPSGFDRVVASVSERGITFADGGQFGNDSIQRGRRAWERIAFLGWDQEEPAIQAGDAVAMGPDGKLRKGGYTTAGKLDPRICNAEQCGLHHDPSDPACVRAKHRTPPRGLPFKRHPDCHMPSIHVVEVMCMGCEAAIATEATDADRNAAHERALQAPSRADACPPSPSGLGGTVGPVLAKLR